MRIDEAEDLVRQTLRSKADDARIDLTMEDVRRGAVRARRSRRGVTVLAAAAAVVAVAVPTAVLLRPADDAVSPAPSPTAPPTPAPTTPITTPSTATTGPSPTATPDATATHLPPGALGQLPLAAPPGVTYLEGRTIHLATGGTAPLPGTTGTDRISALLGYRGGWLVADDDTFKVLRYDGTGALQEQGAGTGIFAVSPDGTQAAYALGGTIRVGDVTGMGQGEQTITPTDGRQAWPVGFLPGGTLVYNDNGRVTTHGSTTVRFPAAMVRADAVSADGLVAGEDANQGAVVIDSRTGSTVWSSSDLTVQAFSQDGRYAAATDVANGEHSREVILDTRTWHVVADQRLLDVKIVLDGTPVFDSDDSLLFPASSASTGDRAILRLATDDTLTRATDLVGGKPNVAGPQAFLLATR